MKIFNYDSNTLEFINEVDAFESPLEPGNFLIPANATDISPPTCGENQTCVFNSGKWDVVDDYRGAVVYDTASGDKFVISEFGLIPDQYTTNEKPDGVFTWNGDAWVRDKQNVVEDIINKIHEYKQQQFFGGVTVDNVTFKTDLLSRTQYSLLIQSATPTVQWEDATGNLVEFSIVSLSNLLNAIGTQDVKIVQIANKHITAVTKSKNPSSYEWHAGWPIIIKVA